MRIMIKPDGRTHLFFSLPTGLFANRVTLDVLLAVLNHYTRGTVVLSMNSRQKAQILAELRGIAARFPGLPLAQVHTHDGTDVAIFP